MRVTFIIRFAAAKTKIARSPVAFWINIVECLMPLR
jgi:hypothetical protein